MSKRNYKISLLSIDDFECYVCDDDFIVLGCGGAGAARGWRKCISFSTFFFARRLILAS